jgi:saccharopine dehydrogenase (NADP+, L-glutamate forming)
MTPPLIEHLIAFKDTKITVASNVLAQAEALVSVYGDQYLSAVYLDITNVGKLEEIISNHDHVISFVPPWMHNPICQACLKLGKNMTTSSYISPDMEKIHKQVKDKGLVFLNECGLDPGIDILGTMKIVHEAEAAGYKVVSYESYCGGIPVAEQADNPLGYKFSWNPGAGIKASRNTAIFQKDGKRVVTNTPLKCAENRDSFSVSMKLESYPNRDSTVFQERFGMKDCHTFIRGTLRFSGFSTIISAFHDIGLTSDDWAPTCVKTLRDLLEFRLKGIPYKTYSHEPIVMRATDGMSFRDADLIKRAFLLIDFAHLKNEEQTQKAV